MRSFSMVAIECVLLRSEVTCALRPGYRLHAARTQGSVGHLTRRRQTVMALAPAGLAARPRGERRERDSAGATQRSDDERRYRHRGDALAPADEAHPLAGRRL